MSKRRISCSKQAQAKSARGNHHGLSDPSRPSKLGRIPCQNASLRITVSLAIPILLSSVPVPSAVSVPTV